MPNKKHLFIAFGFTLVALLFAGCGQNVRLTGTVTFSDDGSPLTTGTVVFIKDGTMSRGDIKPDGTFVVGSLGERDGLPPGTYNVHISGALEVVSVSDGGDASYRSLIDEKMADRNRSELTVEVTARTKVLDIQVDRPATNRTRR